MQIRRNIPGSLIPETIYFEDREIDKMCREALKDSGFLPSAPGEIDIESFIEKHFSTNIDYSTEVAEGVLGWTLFGDRGQVMLVGVSPKLADGEDKISDGRLRATLAHEAGHCLMHPILFMNDKPKNSDGAENLDFTKNRILCRKEDFKSINNAYNGRWWELQANKAIGGFLMPRSLVRTSVSEYIEKNDAGKNFIDPRNLEKAVEIVSETFAVNKMPAEIRINNIFSSH